MKRKLSAALAAVVLCLTLPVATAAHWPWYSPVATTAPSSAEITAEAARTAALNHAGVKSADARFLTTVSYPKHLVRVYKVVFVANDTCHVYEIDRDSGAVLESFTHPWYTGKSDKTDKDRDPNADSYIGEVEAKRIALAHAGVAESSLTKFESKLKLRSDRTYYKVEFKIDKVKYEYHIDAATGDVIAWEQH